MRRNTVRRARPRLSAASTSPGGDGVDSGPHEFGDHRAVVHRECEHQRTERSDLDAGARQSQEREEHQKEEREAAEHIHEHARRRSQPPALREPSSGEQHAQRERQYQRHPRRPQRGEQTVEEDPLHASAGERLPERSSELARVGQPSHHHRGHRQDESTADDAADEDPASTSRPRLVVQHGGQRTAPRRSRWENPELINDVMARYPSATPTRIMIVAEP